MKQLSAIPNNGINPGIKALEMQTLQKMQALGSTNPTQVVQEAVQDGVTDVEGISASTGMPIPQVKTELTTLQNMGVGHMTGISASPGKVFKVNKLRMY